MRSRGSGCEKQHPTKGHMKSRPSLCLATTIVGCVLSEAIFAFQTHTGAIAVCAPRVVKRPSRVYDIQGRTRQTFIQSKADTACTVKMTAPLSLDPVQDSVSFKHTLKSNRSSAGYQLYSVQNYHEPCKVNWLLNTQTATTVDCRASQYNTVAPCPTVQPTTIHQLFRKHWAGGGDPSKLEEEFITSHYAHQAVYASDIQLIDIPDRVGNRFATLLDVPMPISDEFYQVQVRATCGCNMHLKQHTHSACSSPQGPKNSFCCYAPTAIAASDEGLGSQGYMDPGIASAVGIFSSTFTTARLHAEDGFLGSANLLVKGAPKVRSSDWR